jgi:uncharacterized protein HemX
MARPASDHHDRSGTPTGPTSEPRSPRRPDDRGEGVISAAIAVLVMAFLGALMWVGFQQMWETTQQQTNDQISRIGG